MRQNLCAEPARMTKRQLEQENFRLQSMADRDWLTGLYNRGAMERKINEHLQKKLPGTIIVMDLDHFKQVNDRYGHIAGDELLSLVGTVLHKMSGSHGIVGRVGGDEFVIFMDYIMPEKARAALFERIKERFREVRLKNSIIIKLSLTMAAADSLCGRGYVELFDRADQKIMEMKRLRNAGKTDPNSGGTQGSLILDMSLIAGEMEENAPAPGAYCQDYNTFKQIYRLTERRLLREKRQVYIILFTLTDHNNEFLPLEIRDREMDILGRELQKGLRMGDIYTQYSSCQYLVMVSDASGDNTDMIAQRICGTYYEALRENGQQIVLHHSYPLKAAKNPQP